MYFSEFYNLDILFIFNVHTVLYIGRYYVSETFYVFLYTLSCDCEYQQARYNVYMIRNLNESIFNMILLLPCMWDIYRVFICTDEPSQILGKEEEQASIPT